MTLFVSLERGGSIGPLWHATGTNGDAAGTRSSGTTGDTGDPRKPEVLPLAQIPPQTMTDCGFWTIAEMQSLEFTTLSLEPKCLRSGRAFGEILHGIDEDFFNEMWIEKIAHYDADSNWRVKANNLRKLIRSLGEYYEECVHRIVKGTHLLDIDEMEFAESGSTTELLKMAVLIVGAAFLGTKQKKFVEGITVLSSDVQGGVMQAIQSVMEGSEKRNIPTPISQDEVLPDLKPNGGGATSSSSGDELGGRLASLSKEVVFSRVR
ncbi:unnamed protein product [Heligmosomoides polygyrus]|uniref:HOOK_N domain-containing protein n=1 Tax=Heligmosomoides polygyrus TaxID=6339 RepID=A0A3P7X5B0_HELPZ|nr:unnamed protein product [Heligmosomoides polygyrus]